MIRSAIETDSEQIARIYNHYVLNSVITFEEAVVSSHEMCERICSTQKDELPWLVFEQDSKVLGYAYASKWKERCAYRYAVESTVYLDQEEHSRGLGCLLYSELIKELKERNFHVAIGGIALPNDSSIGLHEKFGFEKVAHFNEVGYKFDNWVDVGYWQLTLGAKQGK